MQYRVEGGPEVNAVYIDTNVTVDFTAQTAVITDLEANTPYVVRVRARASSLTGVWFRDPGRAITDARLNRVPTVTILESRLVHPAPLVTSPVTSGAEVILQGRATDPDTVGFGGSRDFVWTQTSGTIGMRGTLGASTSVENTPGQFEVIATFTAPIVAINTDFVFTLTVTDDFGASATGMVTVTVEPEAIAPTVRTWSGLGVPPVGEVSTTTITFSEPVALETTDFTVINATVDSVVGSDDSTTSVTWMVSYTPAATGMVSLTLNADSVTDRAGLTGPATAATRTGTAFPDTTPPTVLTWEDPLQPSTVDQASTTTITFSEPVALETTDFTVINADVDSVASSDGSTLNAIWEVTYTPIAAAEVSLTLDADSVTDRFSNPGPATAETRTGTAVLLDTTAPTVLTWDALGTSTVGQASTTTITFSEPVTLETTDFTVAFTFINAPINSVASSDGSTPNAIWEVTYTPIAAAEVSLTLKADSVTDRASNTGPATAELRTGTATVLLPTTLSGLDGVAGVDFADAKILYYAHAEAFSSVLSDDTDREAVLGNLTTRDTAEVLVDARALELDLNTDGDTDSGDAAVLYYSFTLEGSLGDGTANSGIPAIRNAILTPLLEGGSRTVDEMLQAAHALR